jgi:hypothetical protein
MQLISVPTDMSTITGDKLFSGTVTSSKEIKLGHGSGAYYFDIYLNQTEDGFADGQWTDFFH